MFGLRAGSKFQLGCLVVLDKFAKRLLKNRTYSVINDLTHLEIYDVSPLTFMRPASRLPEPASYSWLLRRAGHSPIMTLA